MENNTPQQTKKSKQILLWLFGGVFWGLAVLGVVVLVFRVTNGKLPFSLNGNSKPGTSISSLFNTKSPPPTGAIIRVGNEYIYEQDIKTEMNYAPGNAPDKKQQLLNKLIQDSIILQGAEQDKLLKLDGSIFNSSTKDYLKRIKAITDITKSIENKSSRMSGTVLTFWFFNNEHYGSLGPEKSKAYALQKATEYYQQVLKKELLIDQALEKIKTDSSLDQIGEHKINAGYVFNIAEKENPSFDDNFNKIIRQTKIGQLTPITLIIDKNRPGKPMESLYAFAEIKNKTTGGLFTNYDDWLNAKKKEYEVIYY